MRYYMHGDIQGSSKAWGFTTTCSTKETLKCWPPTANVIHQSGTGMVKRAIKTCNLVLVIECKTTWIAMLRVLPPIKIKLSCNKFGCRLCKNYYSRKRVVLPFATKSVHVESLTGPRQICFAARDANPVYLFCSNKCSNKLLVFVAWQRNQRDVVALNFQVFNFPCICLNFLGKPVLRLWNIRENDKYSSRYASQSLFEAH